MPATGPMPALTILVHFGLERLVSNLECFDDEESAPICAIRYRKATLVFLFVERGAYWHDSAENFVVAECSSHKLEGNEDMVRILAKHGMTIDLGVDNGDFLFIWALLIWNGAEERRAMLDLLGELGANCDPQDLKYCTSLICAVIGGDDFDVRGLLSDGVAVNEKNRHGRDALIYAALARHEAVMVPLLEAGADVHSSDEDGMTALCAACKGGNERIVKRLLESGADISAQDRFGQMAMSIATESGNAPVSRLLRDHETGDHSEAGIEADTKAVVDEAQRKAEIYEVIALFIRDRDVGLPDNKFIQVVRREAIRRGYDKIVPAIWDAILKEKERENDPMIVAERDTEGS